MIWKSVEGKSALILSMGSVEYSVSWNMQRSQKQNHGQEAFDIVRWWRSPHIKPCSLDSKTNYTASFGAVEESEFSVSRISERKSIALFRTRLPRGENAWHGDRANTRGDFPSDGGFDPVKDCPGISSRVLCTCERRSFVFKPRHLRKSPIAFLGHAKTSEYLISYTQCCGPNGYLGQCLSLKQKSFKLQHSKLRYQAFIIFWQMAPREWKRRGHLAGFWSS